MLAVMVQAELLDDAEAGVVDALCSVAERLDPSGAVVT